MLRRWLALLAVANYLLAVTVGERLHDHGQHACSADQGCAHTHGSPRAVEPKQLPGQRKDDSCQVCRFLAQKPIPAQAVETVDSALLGGEVAAKRPIRGPAPVSSARHIRAPPDVA